MYKKKIFHLALTLYSLSGGIDKGNGTWPTEKEMETY